MKARCLEKLPALNTGTGFNVTTEPAPTEWQCSPKAWKNKWLFTREHQCCLSRNGKEHSISHWAGINVLQREESVTKAWLPAEEGRKEGCILSAKQKQNKVKFSSQASWDTSELACVPCENLVILQFRHKPENLGDSLAIHLHFMWTPQAPELPSTTPPTPDPYHGYLGFPAQRNNDKKLHSLSFASQWCTTFSHLSHHNLSLKLQNIDPIATFQNICHWELQLGWPEPSSEGFHFQLEKNARLHTLAQGFRQWTCLRSIHFLFQYCRKVSHCFSSRSCRRKWDMLLLWCSWCPLH